MDMDTATELAATRDAMRWTLQGAMTQRGNLPDFETRDGRTEPAWVWFEREQMAAAVNRLREGRGLDPVPVAEIERVEASAEGHVDYFEKFAFGCAQLVHGIRP